MSSSALASRTSFSLRAVDDLARGQFALVVAFEEIERVFQGLRDLDVVCRSFRQRLQVHVLGFLGRREHGLIPKPAYVLVNGDIRRGRREIEIELGARRRQLFLCAFE